MDHAAAASGRSRHATSGRHPEAPARADVPRQPELRGLRCRHDSRYHERHQRLNSHQRNPQQSSSTTRSTSSTTTSPRYQSTKSENAITRQRRSHNTSPKQTSTELDPSDHSTEHNKSNQDERDDHRGRTTRALRPTLPGAPSRRIRPRLRLRASMTPRTSSAPRIAARAARPRSPSTSGGDAHSSTISPSPDSRQTPIFLRLRSSPACNMKTGLLELAPR